MSDAVIKSSAPPFIANWRQYIPYLGFVLIFAFFSATLYNQGTIVGLTGANVGQTRTIVEMSSGTVSLLKAWLYPVAIGDSFQLLPGCDHTTATCRNVFGNFAHFGGFPYIPPPELAV